MCSICSRPQSSTLQVRNMTAVLHSFDVYELLILPFDRRLSFINLPWSSVLLIFYFLPDLNQRCTCIIKCLMLIET